MRTHSDRNLMTIENFILHMTHCSIGGGDDGYDKPFNLTPEQMYQCAIEYIEEDHSDGKDNEEDIIPNFTADSSYASEDVEKKFPEHVVITADYGWKKGNEVVGRMSNIDNLANVRQLINKVENPYD